MTVESLTVLGGDNTAFSVASPMQLQGARVTLCEIPSFEWAVTPIRETHHITLGEIAAKGTAELARVSSRRCSNRRS